MFIWGLVISAYLFTRQDSECRVRDSGQAQSIGGTDTPGIPCTSVFVYILILHTDLLRNQAMRDHNRKSKRVVASPKVKRCLLTQELSSEASVSSCYLLNQRLWNSELVSSTEHRFGDCSDWLCTVNASGILVGDGIQFTRPENRIEQNLPYMSPSSALLFNSHWRRVRPQYGVTGWSHSIVNDGCFFRHPK